MRKLLALSVLASSLAFGAAPPPPQAQKEISHLLHYLGHAGCQFNRNGNWYEPARAVDHVNEKYQYLLRRGLVGSAEEFIARAASESSQSHRPYQVRCGNAAPVAAADWLRAELVRYRAGATR